VSLSDDAAGDVEVLQGIASSLGCPAEADAGNNVNAKDVYTTCRSWLLFSAANVGQLHA
jgi:hypothetical protein